MDYYEELGLRRSASAEEIHAAYRVLARLLHPDSQHNEQSRAVAECQMRRLNHVMETLSDTATRAAYDRHLSERARRRRVPRRAPAGRGHKIEAAAWISIVALFLLGIFLFQDSGSNAARISALERENAGLRRELQQLHTGVNR